jgi:DNA invertase Pin-like site-specific DNA recombinase
MTQTMQLIPAAQYLRMSDEHQQYSTFNQRQAIQAYADQNSFTVIQTYEDDARSGIVIKNRDGLNQMLHDVVASIATYKAILVYDVSRWGRFQDTDESAFYEFQCRRAGIPVHYCAEPFSNKGTPLDSIVKAMKRMMAAEFSRELGVKVVAGKQNLVRRGFRTGALPGFGLRRMLVSPDGVPRQILAQGERKAIQWDRVILVPGPDEEVAWVREIFRLFIAEKYNYRQIAELLNEKGVARSTGNPWDHFAVRYILTNTKYNGVITYGKWTRRLHTKTQRVPESEWVKAPHPSAKLIDDTTFLAAQKRIRSFTVNRSDEELLEELRRLMVAKGRLSSDIIRKTPGATAPNVYHYRFGGLQKALELIGYSHPRAELVVTRKRVQDMRNELMEQLRAIFPQELLIRGRGGRTRNWLQLRSGAKISVRFCIHPISPSSNTGWILRRAKLESHWTTLIALLDRKSAHVEKLLIFPRVPDKNFYISARSSWLKLGIPVNDLDQFLKTVSRVRLKNRSKRRQ